MYTIYKIRDVISLSFMFKIRSFFSSQRLNNAFGCLFSVEMRRYIYMQEDEKTPPPIYLKADTPFNEHRRVDTPMLLHFSILVPLLIFYMLLTLCRLEKWLSTMETRVSRLQSS